MSDVNSSSPHAAHTYVPGSNVWSYFPVNARSVPFCRSTAYSSGDSSFRHSASDLSIRPTAPPDGAVLGADAGPPDFGPADAPAVRASPDAPARGDSSAAR